jgi:hypothetical protein
VLMDRRSWIRRILHTSDTFLGSFFYEHHLFGAPSRDHRRGLLNTLPRCGEECRIIEHNHRCRRDRRLELFDGILASA